MVVNDFGFMRWNHASFRCPRAGGRHYRNCRRIVVPGVVMAMVIVLLVMMLLVMMLMATVATVIIGAVR